MYTFIYYSNSLKVTALDVFRNNWVHTPLYEDAANVRHAVVSGSHHRVCWKDLVYQDNVHLSSITSWSSTMSPLNMVKAGTVCQVPIDIPHNRASISGLVCDKI